MNVFWAFAGNRTGAVNEVARGAVVAVAAAAIVVGSKCKPAPGRSYTSGEACKLNVTYKGGQWQFVRDLSQ